MNSQVQARFYVAQITRHAFNIGSAAITLNPVSRGPENKTWAASTPAGKVELTISNEVAAAWFEERLGKDIAITFEDRPMHCTRCKGEVTMGGQYIQDPEIDGQMVCMDCYRASE